MKTLILALLLFILFLGLYIYLNHYVTDKKEGFEPNVLLDNSIKDSFNKSIDDITIYANEIKKELLNNNPYLNLNKLYKFNNYFR